MKDQNPKINIPNPKIKMYGLIRDKDGNPKIDGDPSKLHPAIKSLLTEDERVKLGIE